MIRLNMLNAVCPCSKVNGIMNVVMSYMRFKQFTGSTRHNKVSRIATAQCKISPLETSTSSFQRFIVRSLNQSPGQFAKSASNEHLWTSFWLTSERVGGDIFGVKTKKSTARWAFAVSRFDDFKNVFTHGSTFRPLFIL